MQPTNENASDLIDFKQKPDRAPNSGGRGNLTAYSLAENTDQYFDPIEDLMLSCIFYEHPWLVSPFSYVYTLLCPLKYRFLAGAQRVTTHHALIGVLTGVQKPLNQALVFS